MSAVVECKILGGTSIEEAYKDCRRIGEAIGAGVVCHFNRVEMFWCKWKTEDDWLAEYARKIGRDLEGGAE